MTNQATTYTARHAATGDVWEYLTSLINRKGLSWVLSSATLRVGNVTPFKVYDETGALVADYR